jgi:hypothetical protein
LDRERVYQALQLTAETCGVELETVFEEIELLIADGMGNATPAELEIWNTIPRECDVPTPIELMEFLAECILREKHAQEEKLVEIEE